MNTTAERSAEREQVRRLLEAEIDSLPDDSRAVFMLRAVQELSVEETADMLGIPQATVRSRLFRARSLLREALAAKALEPQGVVVIAEARHRSPARCAARMKKFFRS